jgi:hypothetical protein
MSWDTAVTATLAAAARVGGCAPDDDEDDGSIDRPPGLVPRSTPTCDEQGKHEFIHLPAIVAALEFDS